MATFPSTLPAPLADGYGISPIDPSIRTDMEMGAARTRRRTFARNDKVPVVWRFKDTELATFRTWFDSSTGAAGGSAWFTISLPLGNGGFTTGDAKFVGAFEVKNLGGLIWSVTAKLETR